MTNYRRSQDRITGKAVLHGIIENTSPLLIASGSNNSTDKDCIRWVDGQPYIPSSSITGALRAWYKKIYTKEYQKEEFFWGTSDTSKTQSYQSHFVIDECLLIDNTNGRFDSRDGVAIEHCTGIAKDKSKYDYELLEAGHKFSFRLESTYRQSFSDQGKHNLKDVEDILERIASILQFELFAVGAHTTTGFGRLAVSDLKKQIFDFETKEVDRDAWFKYVEDEQLAKGARVVDSAKIGFQYCKIDGHFLIKSALLTSTYPTDVDSPDKVQLRSKGKNILSGKAIKGALRHRATKILNTLNHTNTDKAISTIFGTVDHKNKSAIKSRLYIEETIIERGVKDMIQDRIKIDRWTGGVIGGAKFDSQPIWNVAKNDDEAFCISLFLLQPDSEEIALLLHLMKDLWTGDLPIGGEKNVGRGVLQGVCLEVNTHEDQNFKVTKVENNSIKIHDPLNKLEKWNTTDLTNLKIQ